MLRWSSEGLRGRGAELALFLVVGLVAAALQHRTLSLGSLINADPTQQVWLHFDEATVNYDAKRIADGAVMYRDFFAFQGPVHYYLYALLFAVFGASFEAARVLTVVTLAVTAGLIAVLIFRVFARTWSGALGGAAGGWIHAAGFVPTWSCTYPHWTAEGLLLGALLLLSGARAPPQLAGAGALLAASTLTILSLGLPPLLALGVAVAALALSDRSIYARPRDAAALAAGAAAPLLVVVLGFTLAGALGDLVYDTLIWPFAAYGEGQADLRGYASYYERTVGNHAALGTPWSALGWLLAQVTAQAPRGALLGGVSAAAWRLIRLRGATPPSALDEARVLAALGCAAAVSPLVLGVSRNDMTHLAFVGSFGLVGTAASLSLLGRWAARGAALALGIAMVGIVVNHVHMHGYTEPDRRGWREYIEAHPETRRLRPHLEAGGGLVDTGYFGGMRYFYLEDAATPMTFIPGPRKQRYYTDAQWAELAGAIVDRKPAVLHVDDARFALLCRHAPGLGALYRRAEPRIYVLER